jgi:lipase
MTRGEPETSLVHANGTELALYDWGGDGPPVLLVHATGLCARVWDPLVAALPDGPRVLALDLRGHGQSPAPDPIPPRFDWRDFGRDIGALMEALGLEDVTVVGHSMGAHSAVIAALAAPERVSRLLLFDPALAAAPPPGAPPPPVAAEQPSVRRRSEWASPGEFFERLSGQPPFATWDEAALRAYTTHGLTRDASTGRYHLACPPLFEASVYANRHAASLDDVLGDVRARVSVVRARDRRPDDPPGLGPSATRVESVAAFPVVRDRQLPNASHFFPLETPALAAGLVMEALEW